MKSVKSVADLKQLALRSGAAVTLGTTRFNSSNERVTPIARREAPAPEPAPAPVPEPAPVSPIVNIDTTPVAQAQERVARLLANALASLPQPATPVREWVFTVERDEKGLLTSIRATAQG